MINQVKKCNDSYSNQFYVEPPKLEKKKWREFNLKSSVDSQQFKFNLQINIYNNNKIVINTYFNYAKKDDVKWL